MFEQRKYPRENFSEPVQYQLKQGGSPQGCLACDYSEGGLRLTSQKFISLHTRLFLDFITPAQGLRRIAGKVVWVRRIPYPESYQFGISFEK